MAHHQSHGSVAMGAEVIENGPIFGRLLWRKTAKSFSVRSAIENPLAAGLQGIICRFDLSRMPVESRIRFASPGIQAQLNQTIVFLSAFSMFQIVQRPIHTDLRFSALELHLAFSE